MKGLFDVMALAFGVVGLAAMAFHGEPLTAENATIHATRALIVIAFVVVPFCMGRALEKLDLAAPLALVKQLRATYAQPPQEKADTLFFDYFFQPDSAREWEPARPLPMREKNTDDGNLNKPRPDA